MNLVERLLEHPGEAVALVAGDRRVTYADLAALAARWRGGLAAAGIGPGHRVAVVAGNRIELVLAELALLGAGAVLVPLNPQSPPAELARELAAVEPAGVITVGPAAEAAWSELVTAEPGWADRHLDPEGWADAAPAPVASVGPDTPAALLFTSGTGGPPRPAVLTHGNLDAALRSLLALPVELVGAGHVVLAVIPLFHVFGLNAVLNLGLAAGATVVLADHAGPVSPTRVARAVAEHGVTILSGPPTLWQALAASTELEPADVASVRLAVSGAAHLPPETAAAVHSRLGLTVAEGYGLTETGAVAATGVGDDAPVGSVGRPVPGVEVRLVDPAGADVLVGDPGEVWLRGPMVSPGWFVPGADRPEPRTDPDGWLHTGDLATVDADGRLAIVDRLRDLVIVSGFNVFPGEVEEILVLHPDVAAAGVVGEPDPATGERVVAHVVPVAGHRPDPADLIAHCRRHLARYKVPQRIEVRDALPVTAIGKVRRAAL